MSTFIETTLPDAIENLDPKAYIIIKGARVNNLKNVDVAIPRNKLVVITGLSGSGKSSLAFDTLFAEGQRMYVESLSSYARQFLGRMEKPEVEFIRGVSPAIAIEQKVNTRNARSTVGTTTEIYDYLKLFFARIGVTYSPVSNTIVKKDTVDDVVNYILNLPEGERFMILCPLEIPHGRTLKDELKVLMQKGFARVQFENEIVFIEELVNSLPDAPKTKKKADPEPVQHVKILIDRAVVKKDDEDGLFRITDSIQTAFYEGHGICEIQNGTQSRMFSDTFAADGITFEEPSINLFSFNNPYGACKKCDGFGTVMGIDEDLVIPDKSLSIFDGAISPWRGDTFKAEWLQPLLRNGILFNFPVHRAYHDLTEEEKALVWNGNPYFKGVHSFFKHLEAFATKIQYRVMLSRFKGKTQCPECLGSGLRKDAGYVKIGGKSIIDLSLMSILEVMDYFNGLELTAHEAKVTKQILTEIKNRLSYLHKVGLGYLTLKRWTSTLSGGEFQRIKLATSLGSALVGSMYILDEPSIGLHPRDTEKLIEVLKSLRDIGNTVIVVEHEEEVMLAADQLIDIGPEAGSRGGQLVFQAEVTKNGKENGTNKPSQRLLDSHTFKYLNGLETISKPTQRRSWFDFVEIKGARENNLKGFNVKFPLRTLTVVTGVSGSGKSTLISKILYPSLLKRHGFTTEETGRYDKMEGSFNRISGVEFVDQNPIGKSSRSNPITYIKAYDHIRNLFAEQPLSKMRDFKPTHFSFNVDGGRCEICEGEGEVTIQMQFMADIHLKCEGCGGRRFKQEVLEVTYKEKDIAMVLDLTVDDAIEFFEDKPRIADKLKPLQEVGLGYIKLGQSSSTLSGGEAQRVKLAYFLGHGGQSQTGIFFIFDEPTTGLHFHDISKLLKAMNALVDLGHTVVVIEHNVEVIKSADWIIDLGPEGGDKGGFLVFEGTPEQMASDAKGYTAKYVRQKLEMAY